MTLLLATVSDDEVVITADGLSVSECLHAPGRTTLQKIFPLASRRMAIAQCGCNFLEMNGRGRVSFAKAIAEWCDSGWPLMVDGVASCLETRIRAADHNFFGRFRPTIWVTGYCEGSERPQFWRVTESGCGEEMKPRHSTGAGADLLQGHEWSEHVAAWDVAVAEQQKQGRLLFGGHRHQVRVTTTGYEWIEPPAHGFLGIDELLPALDIRDSGNINDARCSILSAREELQSELCLRALTDKGRHPTTYGGAKENWATESLPDDVWALTDGLIAICDEAALANPADVSEREALLYRAHVREVIESLPGVVNPN